MMTIQGSPREQNKTIRMTKFFFNSVVVVVLYFFCLMTLQLLTKSVNAILIKIIHIKTSTIISGANSAPNRPNGTFGHLEYCIDIV